MMKFKKILINITIFAYFLIIFGCSNKNEVKYEMDRQEIIKIANKKAQELGYIIEDMKIDIKKEGKEYIVYYSPPNIQLGGDLTVFIDAMTGEVSRFERGQ